MCMEVRECVCVSKSNSCLPAIDNDVYGSIALIKYLFRTNISQTHAQSHNRILYVSLDVYAQTLKAHFFEKERKVYLNFISGIQNLFNNGIFLLYLI